MTRSDRVLACAVAAIALAWGTPTLTTGYEGPYDEGNTLCAAWRVLEGEVPYRDFWTLHSPGTTWLLAGAFRIFGATLGVERAVKLGIVALAAVLVFFLARLAARPGGAAAAAFLFVVLPTQTLSLRSRDTGLALVLATLLVACSPTDRPRRRALLAGLLAGLTACFKQDFALAAAVAAGCAVVLPAVRGSGTGRRARAIRDVLVPFGAGVFAAPAALAAALAASDSLGEFFRQAILFPATEFAAMRRYPVGASVVRLATALRARAYHDAAGAAFVPVLFASALAAAVAALLWALTRFRSGESTSAATTLSAGLAGVLLLDAARVRADLEHLNPAVALALVALACVAAPRREAPPASRVLTLGARAALAGVLAVTLTSLAERAAERPAGLPTDIMETASFVASESRPGERIFVGNSRHDRVLYNAPLVYFLAGRRNATRYDNLHPGVVTTRPVQQEIVRAMEAAGTRLIVLWDGPAGEEPNGSAASSGITVLDDWISSHASEAACFGGFHVLRVREPAPGPVQ